MGCLAFSGLLVGWLSFLISEGIPGTQEPRPCGSSLQSCGRLTYPDSCGVSTSVLSELLPVLQRTMWSKRAQGNSDMESGSG